MNIFRIVQYKKTLDNVRRITQRVLQFNRSRTRNDLAIRQMTNDLANKNNIFLTNVLDYGFI